MPAKQRWWTSVGYVAPPGLLDDDRSIEVLVPDLVPAAAGQVSAETSRNNKLNIKGTEELPLQDSSVELGTSVLCSYLGDAHAVSVPDIVAGERVRIWHQIGMDKFFWVPEHDDAYRRSTEHIHIRCMDKRHNEQPGSGEVWDILVDTREKGRILTLRTGDGRGERFVYNLTIRPDEDARNLVLGDDAGNEITMHSSDRKVSVTNSAGSSVVLDNQDIRITAPGTITLTAPETTIKSNVSIKGPLTVSGMARFPGKHGPPGKPTAPYHI